MMLRLTLTIPNEKASSPGAAQAAFKSTLPRINPQQAGVAPGAAHLANPAPWAYDAKASRLTHNAAQSVFKSKTKRDLADSGELNPYVPMLRRSTHWRGHDVVMA
jgi:hypothetical protein